MQNKLAGLGTGSDGTAECASRRRARVGRSQKTGSLNWTKRFSKVDVLVQQLARWWILVQLGRPDKWDGSEMAWPNWSFVMKAYAGAIDQDLSADMTTAECSTDAVSNSAMTGERKARSVQLCFVLIMLCTGRALDRTANAPHGWCMEALRLLFQAYSPKNNARLVVMMLEVLAFPLDTNDVVNSVETMIPEFLKIGIVIRQAEEGPMRTDLIMNSHRLATFQDIKTAQSAVMARSGDARDVDAFTKGSTGASKGCCKKQDSEALCWCCEKKGNRASDCRKKQRDHDEGQSKGSRKGDSKGKGNKKEVQGQVLQVWQDGSHVEGLQIQRNECIRSWRRVGRDRIHRNGKRRFERVGDRTSAVAGKGSQNSYRNRFVCCSDSVSQECCGRLSDARHARQSEELKTGASQAQRWVSQVREPENC